MHDPNDMQMRTIHKPCKACGTPVPFKVWPGFRVIARHLASMCPGCHCASVLEGDDSWHRSHTFAKTHPIRSNGAEM